MLEPLISKGVITNVSNQDLLKGIEFHYLHFIQCYYLLMELKANFDGGLRDEDAGVVYDVLYMRTKYKILDVQCAMLTKLAFFCYQHITCDVQLNALNAEGPNMSMPQISEFIDETTDKLQKIKKLSCWKYLKNKVPASCRGKVDTKEECPSLAKEGAQKVAEKFEVNRSKFIFKYINFNLHLGSHQTHDVRCV
jgi:hypothetical protein